MALTLNQSYAERVYAGVLGKIIGVYLGRPFEGWLYRDILAKLGEVGYYVHDRLNQPLVVTDDDISGTFTFLRAIEDYGPGVTAEQVGQSWLNYLIENRTVLWWGGYGNSTEHTAYLRLKRGMKAPASGSIATNGKVVAEQIGAQIFIDGWGLINPGDPERAAEFARIAGSVSHDGEAIYGAQVVAALVAQAFVEDNVDRLLDTAVSLIPADSVIYRLIADLREWHAASSDWQTNFEKIEQHYGYDKYGGNCHMVPNHGVIVHALLHGAGDWDRSMMIVNTCGWDTDCNSGNLGCILGVLNGLAGFEKQDWRGPVADRMYLPTADGGRCVTDAVQETDRIVAAARSLRGESSERPARYHFAYPGSVQGFRVRSGSAVVTNESGQLSITAETESRVTTETLPTPETRKMGGYGLFASPTLYPGQTIVATVKAAESTIVRLTVDVSNGKDELDPVYGEEVSLLPGETTTLCWTVPDTGGYPVVEVGLQVGAGTVYVESLDWHGTPHVQFKHVEGTLWREAWVNGVSDFHSWGSEPYRLIQNEGVGLLMQGTREWTDYRVSADVVPHMVEFGGIAARVQGMRRYYALLLHRAGEIRLVKSLDGEATLATAPLEWQFGDKVELALEVEGDRIRGYVNGKAVVEAQDGDLASGAVAYVLCDGRMASQGMSVGPMVPNR